MSIQVLNRPETASVPLSSQAGSRPRFGRIVAFSPASVLEPSGLANSMPASFDYQHDNLGLVRGLRAAILIEAAAALLLYGIWYFWHLLR